MYENEISFYDDSSDCSDDLADAQKENIALCENLKFLNQIPKGILFLNLRILMSKSHIHQWRSVIILLGGGQN